ncbi:hypothetical protein [Thiolapillus sp.]|uniref:hypothetical protein n=1 Tax=Thiolapillus sp. TaxID=2017437 RepID=UPI003AF94379
MRSCCVALGDQDGWGTNIGCQRPSRFWGLGCPKIYHEAEDTLAIMNTSTPISTTTAPVFFQQQRRMPRASNARPMPTPI